MRPTIRGLICVLMLANISHAAFAETIVLVHTMPVPTIVEHRDAFVQTVVAAGLDESYDIVEFQADGDYVAAVEFLELQRSEGPPALVVAFATLASQAAVAVFGPGSGVPVLFCVVVDPVGAGIVDRVGVASGTNISGIVYTIDRTVKIEKALELLRTASPRFPEPVTVGVPHSSYPSERGDVAALRAAARDYPAFTVVDVEYAFVPGASGVPEMRRSIAESVSLMEPLVDFWWEAVGPMSERNETVSAIASASVRPMLMSAHPAGVADGALFSISPDQTVSGKRLAAMALRILSGESAGTFPVLPASAFRVALNLSTAGTLAVVPPSYLLELAGESVYR